MHTNLAPFIKDTPQGKEAADIVRKCVHCGFCTATCPTYQLLGDELDGPRGRIYLIKQMLEGEESGEQTRLHLDRCLTCRSCETTCPSGVEYGRLLDIGRQVAEQRTTRHRGDHIKRKLIRTIVPNTKRFSALLAAGRLLRPILPKGLKQKVLPRQAASQWTVGEHKRKMLILDGCVQPALAPSINAVASRVLGQLGISLVTAEASGCCGGVSLHLSAEQESKNMMRKNIDAWWPYVESGVEAVVSSASGCSVTIKDYGYWLADDKLYARKAKKISNLARDLAEVVASEGGITRELKDPRYTRVAFQSPCTLQHGLKLGGAVEKILIDAGYELQPVANAHLCCGSAGTYSLLQPQISGQLRVNKLDALHENQPDVIATANIGCYAHLQSGTQTPVRHWVELLSD